MKKLIMLMLCLRLGLCHPRDQTTPPPPCMDVSCTDVPMYPAEDIIRTVDRSPYYRHLLGPNGMEPLSISPMPVSGTFIEADKGPRKDPNIESYALSSNFEQACEVTPVVTEYPKTARNTQNVTRYIVNAGDYRQPVSTERCRHENESCSNLAKYLVPGVTTACRSSSVTLSLVVYDEASKTLGTDQFSFPTACVCFYKDS